MSKIYGYGAIAGALLLAGASAAEAQAPGAIVTPYVAPAVGQMHSDAVKQQTDSAVKKATDPKAATGGTAAPTAAAPSSGSK